MLRHSDHACIDYQIKEDMNPLKLLFATTIIPAFCYKHGALILMSLPISMLIEFIYNGSFLGISITIGILFVSLITTDFFTGVIAARYNKEEFESTKVAFTFYKIFMYFAFFWMLFEFNKLLTMNDGWVYDQGEYFISFVRSFIFIILVFREYISIGENIQKRFGKKPYIFNLAEKIADIIERTLLKKIENSELCDPKDKKNENS
jgi:hypothetical protein